jgi:hypothetical protein
MIQSALVVRMYLHYCDAQNPLHPISRCILTYYGRFYYYMKCLRFYYLNKIT